MNRAPIGERLRKLVVTVAGEPTVMCEFRPGGRLNGVGIRSKLYCENCGQSLIWHEVAEGVRFIAEVEDGLRRANAEEGVGDGGSEHGGGGDRAELLLSGHAVGAVAAVADESAQALRRGESRGAGEQHP